MGKQYQGRAFIRIDGAEYPTGDDATLDIGGYNRGTEERCPGAGL